MCVRGGAYLQDRQPDANKQSRKQSAVINHDDGDDDGGDGDDDMKAGKLYQQTHRMGG